MKDKYKKLLSVLKENKSVGIGEVDTLISKLEACLWACELEDKYGIVLPHDLFRNKDYVNIKDDVGIFKYGEGTRRSIVWSDDGTQPGDEYLLNIGFSTGPYIFGDDYPVQLFQEFWQELKSYNPDFIDSHNNHLYWRLENAKDILEKYNSIKNKYHEINKVDSKKRKIERLKKELEDLN